jgi:Tol biopolymer transport system component
VVWGRRILVVAALALIGAVATVPGADATFAGISGKIAFDTPAGIWIVSPDGHRLRKIGDGNDPSFDSEGQLIAYDKGTRKLMIMRDDGSGVRTVYTDDHIGEPAFSTDNRTLFFVKDTSGEGYSDIWSVPVAGGEATRLTHTGSKTSEISSSAPEASSGGGFVVYQRGGSVWTMRPNGSRQKELARGSTPSISPDDRQVVLARNEKLVIVRASGGHERVIDPFGGKPRREGELIRAVGYPVWSPNGREIAFTLKRTTDAGPHLHDTKRLVVYDLRTGKLREITKPTIGGAHPDWQPVPYGTR